MCECPPDFTGKHCETYRCSMYCKNKGTCYTDVESKTRKEGELPPLKCLCPRQWTGDRCEISESTCRKTCHNGATCSFDGNRTVCHCAPGYNGQWCENCDDRTCVNGGICRKTKEDASLCDCPDGFMGRMCENNTCAGFCTEHGDCKVGVTGPRCQCHPGFSGIRCEIESCDQVCYNGGTCQLGSAMTCACLSRFTGYLCEHDLCETDVPPLECISQPCKLKCSNGGSCTVGTGGPACDCPTGYSGDLCEVRKENDSFNSN